MAKVVFWSPFNSMCGSTHSIIAISTLMSINHKTTSLLMHGNFDSKKIESSYTPFQELKESGVFENSNIGISALIRLATSNKLTADAIQNHAKPVLKERLDVMYGMNQKDESDYIDLVNNIPNIAKKAGEIYDLVFVDLPKGTDEKFIKNALAEADIVVCMINQDSIKLDEFLKKIDSIEELKDKNKIYIVGDYEQKSKYNAQNMKIRYRIKEDLFVIPHNYIFSDSCNDGSVINFFYNNINADSKDYNGYFISQVSNIVEKIIDVAKIKDL